MKILIVEDDQFYSLQLAEFLADNGFETAKATTVQDALNAPLETFGCVISDVMLPNDPSASGISPEATRSGFFSGVALCREIKKRGHTMPLILLSGAMIADEASEWAASQAIPFIFKD